MTKKNLSLSSKLSSILALLMLTVTSSINAGTSCTLSAPVSKDGLCQQGATYVGPWKAKEHWGTCVSTTCGTVTARKTKTKVCQSSEVYAGVNQPNLHGGHCLSLTSAPPSVGLSSNQTSTKNCAPYRNIKSVYVGPNNAGAHWGTCLYAGEPPVFAPKKFEWKELCAYPSCENKNVVTESSEVIKENDSSVQTEIEKRMKICTKVAGEGAVYSASVHACLSSSGKKVRHEKLGTKMTVKKDQSFNVSMPAGINASMQENDVNAIWYYVELANPGNGWTNSKTTNRVVHKNTRTCPSGSGKAPTYGKDQRPRQDSCTRLKVK